MFGGFFKLIFATRLWSVKVCLLFIYFARLFVTLKEVFPLSLLHGESRRKLRFLLQLRPWEDFFGDGT